MDLRAVVAKAIDAGFQAVGDIAVSANVFHLTGALNRDPDTGQYSSSYVSYPCSIIWGEIKRGESRANVLLSDGVILIKRAQVAQLDAKDVVVIGSRHFQVIDFDSDPTDQLMTTYLREAADVVTIVGDQAILSGAGVPIMDGGGVSIEKGS